MNAQPSQVKRIHTLAHLLRIPDDDYRAMIASFGTFPVNVRPSSKKLTFQKANELIRRLSEMATAAGVHRSVEAPGRAPLSSCRPKKYDDLGKRPGMASPAQLRMLEAMWADVSFAPDPRSRHYAYEKFITRITGVSKPEWLEPLHVRKIKTAIESMKRSQLQKENS
jgi:hypothetical protein